MDTFSHALWGYGLFGFRGHARLALLFGALPDLLSFGLLLVIRISTGDFYFGKPDLDSIPGWTFIIYDFTHSLIIAGLAITLVAIKWRAISYAMLAWPFHILLDIPFHSAEFFPTKMLWPLSSFTIDGISWATPWIWYSNLAGLLLLFIYRKKMVPRHESN